MSGERRAAERMSGIADVPTGVGAPVFEGEGALKSFSTFSLATVSATVSTATVLADVIVSKVSVMVKAPGFVKNLGVCPLNFLKGD